MDDILKFERIEGALEDVLSAGQSITAACIEQNYVVLGTASGAVHCLHFSGQLLRSLQVLPPGQRVRQLHCDADASALTVAVCSDAGQVLLLSIPNSPSAECSRSTLNFLEAIHCTCLDRSSTVGASGESGVLYGSSGSSSSGRALLAGTATGKLLSHRAPRSGASSSSSSWYSSSSSSAGAGVRGDAVLFAGNGSAVQSIAWRGALVAWADALHVRVMDVSTQTAICQLSAPPGVGPEDPYPCQLQWRSSSSLLVGWADSFRQVDVEASAGDSSACSAAIQHEWMTDCIICGLCSFDRDHVVYLGYTPPEEEEVVVEEIKETMLATEDSEAGSPSLTAASSSSSRQQQSQRRQRGAEVEVIIAHRSTGELISADLLPLRSRLSNSNDCDLDGPFAYSLLSTVQCREHLDDAEKWQLRKFRRERGGARGYAPIGFVLSRADFVLSRVRDVNDRVAFALQRGDLKGAVSAAIGDKSALTAYQYSDLLRVYLIDLLERQQQLELLTQQHTLNSNGSNANTAAESSAVDNAAAECVRLVGQDSALWEIWIYKFIEYNQLCGLCPMIPTKNPRLPNHVYETVLTHLLQEDPPLFLDTIKRWSKQQQPPHQSAVPRGGAAAVDSSLFDHGRMVQVLEQFARRAGNSYYSEAQAHLHIISGNYERALNCYLDMNPSTATAAAIAAATAGQEGDREAAADAVRENIEKAEYRHVFDLIEREQLFRAVENKFINLVRLSRPLAAKLCLSHIDKLPIRLVAEQLSADKRLLKWYLHLLFTDPAAFEIYRSEVEYGDLHQRQLQLYAELYDGPDRSPVVPSTATTTTTALESTPPKEVDLALFCSQGIPDSHLLRFLESGLAPLDVALQQCELQQPPLHREMIFILAQMGQQRRALQIHLQHIGDVGMAIAFVESQLQGSGRRREQQHRAIRLDRGQIAAANAAADDAVALAAAASAAGGGLLSHYVPSVLWDDLIEFVLQRPSMLAHLLDYLGICKLDPVQVIEQISASSNSSSGRRQIPYLKLRLLRIMRQLRFQTALCERSNALLESDALNLLREQNQGQRRAMKVDSHLRCYACSRPILMQPGAVTGFGSGATKAARSSSNSSSGQQGSLLGAQFYLSGIGNIADSTLWGPPPTPYLDTVHGKSFSTVNGVVVFSSKIAFHRTCYLQLHNQ